jgi:hypothetical protein
LCGKLGLPDCVAPALLSIRTKLPSTRLCLVDPRRISLLRLAPVLGTLRRAIVLPTIAARADVHHPFAPTASKQAPDLSKTRTQGGPENRIRFLDTARRTCDTPPSARLRSARSPERLGLRPSLWPISGVRSLLRLRNPGQHLGLLVGVAIWPPTALPTGITRNQEAIDSCILSANSRRVAEPSPSLTFRFC